MFENIDAFIAVSTTKFSDREQEANGGGGGSVSTHPTGPGTTTMSFFSID